MRTIDSFLNKITMYRLTLYYLIFLVGIASVVLHSVDIIVSSIVAVGVCFIANLIFSKFFKAVTNVESALITALILALIIPTKLPVNLVFIITASILAMLAKYLLVIEKRHLFNPAAVSVAAISLLSPEHAATWWVGTSTHVPIRFSRRTTAASKNSKRENGFQFSSRLSCYSHSGFIFKNRLADNDC